MGSKSKPATVAGFTEPDDPLAALATAAVRLAAIDAELATLDERGHGLTSTAAHHDSVLAAQQGKVEALAKASRAAAMALSFDEGTASDERARVAADAAQAAHEEEAGKLVEWTHNVQMHREAFGAQRAEIAEQRLQLTAAHDGLADRVTHLAEAVKHLRTETARAELEHVEAQRTTAERAYREAKTTMLALEHEIHTLGASAARVTHSYPTLRGSAATAETEPRDTTVEATALAHAWLELVGVLRRNHGNRSLMERQGVELLRMLTPAGYAASTLSRLFMCGADDAIPGGTPTEILGAWSAAAENLLAGLSAAAAQRALVLESARPTARTGGDA